jgi:AraC-like DNA-binding protein
VYDYITNGNLFKKFEVNDLLFVEYKCLIDDLKTGYWTQSNYFVYVVGGRKKWTTSSHEYIAQEGDAIFIKKGAYTAHKFFDDDDFCALLIFVPDEFIKSVLNKYPQDYFLSAKKSTPESDGILRVDMDDSLSTYFHSVLSYFPKSITPPKDLLTIKFEELILHIMVNANNQELKSYFRSLQESSKVSIRQIMESYFMYNMNLEEYARLCARSLSTFKEDFFELYKTTPGKWLISKRLDYAKFLIETTEESINDVAFKSGFKNSSHFVRLFKEVYGKSPLKHRVVSENL